MFLYHLRLLIGKSLRYAWRLRSCHCCPKVIFELFVPLICLLFLVLLRWIHTPRPTENVNPSVDGSKPTNIQLAPAAINPPIESIYLFNYTSNVQCPTSDITIEIVDVNLFNRFKRLCPNGRFILSSSTNRSYAQILLNSSSLGPTFYYRCEFENSQWCQNLTQLTNEYNSIEVEHPSSRLCSLLNIYESKQILRTYLAIESLLNQPIVKQSLTVFTWPCSTYRSDPLFTLAPRFVLIIFLTLIDGCILFAFNLLLHALIEEKSQGITELLRLISIEPILNSLAWFIRVFFIQFLVSIFLILILKLPIDGAIYLPYVSFALIIPTILFWSIQVLSCAILVAHFFTSNLKATLWSWLIFFLSCWLAYSSSIRLPVFLHLLLSAWLPFYSIKRVFVLFFRLNANLGYSKGFIGEILAIWLCMIIGSVLMWLLAYYLEQIFPGKYGIPRSWTWPIDTIRKNRVKQQKRRESVSMQMVETLPDANTTVRVNNLTKTYGRFNTEQQLAVDHVTFKLEKSMIHGLIGHNGAGKTSTMEMMCGLLSCDCGTIEIHDQDLYENLTELQKCIGYCPQQDMLFSHLTVKEQLEFYARVRSKGNDIDSKQIRELLQMMDMHTHSGRLCHTLSGGMQRKLSILCAFVGHANVILLDEPSSSLDPAARRVLWSWLRENKNNRTLLISSHLLDEVEELCDSVIIMDSGKIRAQGTVLELKRQYGPSGDRLHLDRLPGYVRKEWIVDERTNLIQIPDRKQLISLLQQLERDHINYSLENITLDDIFIRLTSGTDSNGTSSEENTTKSQIEKLFQARTNTQRTQLWSQQILGVLFRRGAVFLRRARLLPIVILLYLAYALAPLYMPSFGSLPSALVEQTRYIVSTRPELIKDLPFKSFKTEFTPSLLSPEDFEKYLLKIRTWQSDHRLPQKLIGLRISSRNNLECFVPSPHIPNIITSCLPIYASLGNRTLTPFQLIDKNIKNPLMQLNTISMLKHSPMYFCIYTLPPRLHLLVILLSLILIVCAALTIQDYGSGFHSYSIIHGLHSSIHWLITFISDLLLCLIWLAVLILIERFVHSENFNGRFAALTPLFFIATLPFIYLIARLFQSPIIGATIIITILQFAHFLFTFRFIIEFFRGYRAVSTIIRVLRWVLLLIFPNINVFTLIVAILRPLFCPIDDSMLEDGKEFSDERYPHKVLIHSLILVGQVLLYFLLLIFLDSFKYPSTNRRIRKPIEQSEDDDVTAERTRIAAMNDDTKQREALIVENLSKRYLFRSTLAVDRLTFAVPHRQCFGLLGFNGSGKTTTFRMLMGELQPTAGSIYKSNRESVGYCPQDDVNFPALTVQQSIDYICRLHGLSPSSINHVILSQFQLKEYRHRLVSHLSGGTRRRLHLALCLIGSPTLLLLDEPTAKVDPLLRSQIRSILQHRPIDTSIVFASHSMLECEQLCDRLTILVRGHARCLGSPQHLKEKYGTDYRIRLTPLKSTIADISELERVNNSNEFIYPKSSLSKLFQLLEDLVARNIIASNYTVQLTSLEHIFLAFQHPVALTV